MTNRLANESSPYLLQHAHNPVDWYPWGEEAFAAARSQNKPIFLSVGYSTCYWCHVMERQCFEVDAIAAVMNEKFINIKVDREERPDVDQLYMTAVQVLTQHGGWPMSVFLTPQLRPFYGGTYFLPTDMHGRPGFPTVLRAISDHFHQRPADVVKATDQLVEILRQVAEPAGPRLAMTIDAGMVENLIARSTGDYDSVNGGFGSAPKFPRETLLELLLVAAAKPARGQAGSLGMLEHSLDAMASGGIRDHLGGGFHRYSTDAQWLVPHFEIMLYDNAMLAWCYAEAHRVTGKSRYAEIARGICDFVLREMTSPQGGFYTAFDAEVDAQEGMPYLWTATEIELVLSRDDAAVFKRMYGVDRGPNFADPHNGNGTPEKNVLFLAADSEKENDPRIISMRQKLLQARKERKQPLLDTKILTSWNALMIRALAHSAKLLNEPRYLHAAANAADFLLKHHRTPNGGLFRTSRQSAAKFEAYLDDYAFLIQALLELGRADSDDRWRPSAEEISQQMIDCFYDKSHGGFYFTAADASDLIVRQKTAADSPLPSGNAVAAMSMLELGRPEFARSTITLFAEQMQAHGEGMSAMVQASRQYVQQHGPLVVEPSQQISPNAPAEPVVKLSARWANPQQLIVTVNIQPGFHINATETSKDLIPTRLTLSSNVTKSVAAIDYPAGELRRFDFADSAIPIYAGQVAIIARFSLPVVEGLEVSLMYQACNDSACFAATAARMKVAAPLVTS